MNPLLEHAARVLDHQPTRSMEAEPLYRRAIRESGETLPFPRFMAAVRERTDQFAVLAPDPVVRVAGAWDPRQRCLYEAALDAAGLTQPLIVLTRRSSDAAIDDEPESDAASCDVLAEVHESLTHLLRAADPDDTLYPAVVAAIEELHAMRRALGTGITGGAA